MGGALLCGCAAQSAASGTPLRQSASSILVRSIPAPGSAVSGPVDELSLTYDPPARLDELTINGPDGLMPMMVTAAGETDNYLLPLPDLGPGSYTVSWKAFSRGTAHNGSFSFTIK